MKKIIIIPGHLPQKGTVFGFWLYYLVGRTNPTMLRNQLLLWASLSFLIGCTVEPPQPEFTPPEGSFGLIYTEILSTSCNVTGCHDGFSTHPPLKGQNTYPNLVTDHVHNGEALALGLHLVKPGDPDSSFLYQKVIYDSSDYKFGSPMPAGGLSITGNQIEFLRQWIVAGAPETGHVADRTLLE